MKTGLTGPDGRYRIRVSSPGIYNVWLVKDPQDDHMTAVDDDGIVVEPYKTAQSTLRMVRARMLSGKLIDAEGKPVVNCEVIGMSAARQASDAVQTARTKSNGTFKLAMPPGRAYIYAHGPTDQPLAARPFASVALELPHTGDGPTQVTLKLMPPQPENDLRVAEFLKSSTPGTRIVGHADVAAVTGVVVDAAGAPLSGAKVFGPEGPIVVTNEQGRFRVECEKEVPIRLHAFQPGFHVWSGAPSAGDSLEIVLEKKPVRGEAPADKPTY